MSAVLLFAGGTVLLFASDMILARFLAGSPAPATFLGQLVGAGWLAVGALNWLSQSVLLGGIYGRPQVLTNCTLYVITAVTMFRAAVSPTAPAAIWIVAFVSGAFAAIYAWLLIRGPFDSEFESRRSSP